MDAKPAGAELRTITTHRPCEVQPFLGQVQVVQLVLEVLLFPTNTVKFNI